MDWKRFALGLLAAALISGTLSAACSAPPCSYGEDCNTNADCATPLVCSTFHTFAGDVKKCNQPPGVCTEYPRTWKPTVSNLNLNAPGSVVGTVMELQGGSSPVIPGSSNLYKVGWFSDWRATGLVGVMIAVLVVSLAAIIGHSFNLPEVKAFVDTELMQCVVSVILIICLIGLITFFDQMARLYVANTDIPVNCDAGGTPCYVTVAKQYLQSVYDFGTKHAKEQLVKNVRLQGYANVGYQIQANKWWLLFAGMSIRPSAGLTIEAERAGIIFDTVSKMLASIYAQIYFIDVVSYGIAPILLLLGILLRTFFFTRKLGGLLLAIALALFIVYPLTYAFAWYTLQVQIYGERVSANDPDCPEECLLRPPVAFYTDKETGQLVNFETIQDLAKAGIDSTNWKTGGPGQKYTGFVSCEEKLFGTDLPPGGTNPPNSCPDCPSYCREVPFPSGIAGCDEQKCGACNPGCKVMRARSDCVQPEKCDPASCPASCRAVLPVENKCYQDYFASSPAGKYVPANLSVSCSGCDGCPVWCLVRKVNPDGSIVQAYNDVACQIAACRSPQCPDQCAYLTPIGPSNDCNSECAGCPVECRFRTEGYDLVSPIDYDTEDFNVTYCKSSPAIINACSLCPDVCKSVVPVDPRTETQPMCYPYPQKNYRPSECTDCPDYCRFSSFGFIPGFSNTRTGTSGLPAACADTRIKCSETTVPKECGGSCKVQGPPVCVSYHYYATVSGGDYNYPPEFCNTCHESVRVILRHINKHGKEDYRGLAALTPATDCTDAKCDIRCKPTVDIPREDSQGSGTCKDYSESEGGASDCVKCPVDCRIIAGVPLDPKCSAKVYPGLSDTVCDATYCPDNCKVNAMSPVQQGKVCEAYVGPGSKCVRKTSVSSEIRCEHIKNERDCNSAKTPTGQTACEWKEDQQCYGPTAGAVNCRDSAHINSKTTCMADADKGCRWLYRDDPKVPIDQRDPANPAVSDRSGCKQCPEICRFPGSNDCVVSDNTLDGVGNAYVDCSETDATCPSYCRIASLPPKNTVPNPSGDVCREFITFDLPCYGVPALCRREAGVRPPEPRYCSSAAGCPELCQWAPPPAKACEGCFECDYDCIYKPAVRTDCAEVCSNDALAGPVNIGPADFFKQLPGAAGETDVKNTGVMLVLGLVLPLFSIVMVISFIRVFSHFLGGDVEIPGLSRII